MDSKYLSSVSGSLSVCTLTFFRHRTSARERPRIGDDVRAERAGSGPFLFEPAALWTNGALRQCFFRFYVRVDFNQTVDDAALPPCPLLTALITARTGESKQALRRIGLLDCFYKLRTQFHTVASVCNAPVRQRHANQDYPRFQRRTGTKSRGRAHG